MTPLRGHALSVFSDTTCLNASHATAYLHRHLGLPFATVPTLVPPPPPPPPLRSAHEQAPGLVCVSVQEQAAEEEAEEEAAAVQEEAEEEAAAVEGAAEEAAEEAVEEVGASFSRFDATDQAAARACSEPGPLSEGALGGAACASGVGVVDVRAVCTVGLTRLRCGDDDARRRRRRRRRP